MSPGNGPTAGNREPKRNQGTDGDFGFTRSDARRDIANATPRPGSQHRRMDHMRNRHRAIGTRRIVTATALLAIASIYGAAPAAAHTEEYYTSHMCQATDQNGKHTSDIRFDSGLAVNRHDSATRYLKCPVPYVRKTGNLSAIRVRLRALDQSSVKGILLRICEVNDADDSVVCPIASQVQSGIGFDGGMIVLEAAFTPTAATRWIFWTSICRTGIRRPV
jgi:hypothetical protein